MAELEEYNLRRKDYPFPVDNVMVNGLIKYRTGVCKGCEWHPNVCNYCLRSTIPDFDQPPTKKEEPMKDPTHAGFIIKVHDMDLYLDRLGRLPKER
jgi:hypothetical protein